ncbi:hypothetical protein FRX31_017638 [Thalictrum thalictroides]|uniref:Uncharacterized protein n=1 Tax=Thalictrum thalictroides TaxID=46969 RepID=A0A7J6W8R6_THATH|nr:hypothetical protein FRX31_017638 [Thalictrum thalictroides]
MAASSQTLLGFNPSYYLELATRGILQCLGLNTTSSSSTPQLGEKKTNEMIISSQDQDSPSFTTAEPKMKSRRIVNPRVLKSVGGVRATAREVKPPLPDVGTGKSPRHNDYSA